MKAHRDAPILFLDGNVYEPLARTDPNLVRYKTWVKSGEKFGLRLEGDTNFFVTPFVFLELAGVTKIAPPSGINIPVSQYKKAAADRKFTALLLQLHKSAKLYYQGLPQLQISSLRASIVKQGSRSTLNHFSFYGFLEQKIGDPAYHDRLLENLAWDYVFKHRHRSLWAITMQNAAIVSIYELQSSMIDLCLTRAVKEIWDVLLDTAIKEEKAKIVFRVLERFTGNGYALIEKVRTHLSAVLYRSFGIYSPSLFQLRDSMTFKGNRDFLDIDLIHFAVSGTFTSLGQRPLLCFTTDEEIEIRDRLAVFKSVFSASEAVVRRICHESKFSPPLLTYENGSVFFCDRESGAIKSMIKVSQIKPLPWI